MDWHPIGTAPKDGRDILLYAPESPVNGEPVYVAVSWQVIGGSGFWRGGFDSNHEPLEAKGEFSHWMPIPARDHEGAQS